MHHATLANSFPKIEPFWSLLRLNAKRKLTHSHPAEDLRECIVDVAHTLCALPLRILHVVHHQRNIPFLRRKDGFDIDGLGVYVALGVREAGELQRGVKTRRVGTRVAQNLLGAPTLRGRGLLVRLRGASPNFHTPRAILG